MQYPIEQFGEAEKEILKSHFTNTDRPVFAIDNLPEVTKGALFARYSRYQGTLRRLFLDEFLDSARPTRQGVGTDNRAEKLYQTIFLGYGDDSVAQLGGAHLACEWVSNILTKILQRGRLAAYLEQSTRYIPFDNQLPNGEYRFYQEQPLGQEYQQAMRQLFVIYSEMIPEVEKWAATTWPRDKEPEAVWQNSIKAKSLDLLRGLLPASTLSHVGIFASGQAYEQLIMRLMASPLPEARAYGTMILEELQKIIPSFLSRIERPDRGGQWIDYFQQRRQQTEKWVGRLGLDRRPEEGSSSAVELSEVRGNFDNLLASCLYEETGADETAIRKAVGDLDYQGKAELLAAITAERKNRRHRPGRGLEAISYRFEIVSDYGAFRDLQRHRMLTCQWQRLTPDLGADVPEEIKEAGLMEKYQQALDISRAEYERLWGEGLVEEAPYALCLAYKIRYVLDLNAREAMQLIELRSGNEGHPSYRAVAQQMYERINDVHPALAESMKYVDQTTEPRLERLLSEIRTHHKQQNNQQ